MFEEEREYRKKQEQALRVEAREVNNAIERLAGTNDGKVYFKFLIDSYFSMQRDLNTGNSGTYTRLGYFDCFREFIIEPLMGANFEAYSQIERELMEKRRVPFPDDTEE